MKTNDRFRELKPFFSFLAKYFLQEALMMTLIIIGTVCSLASPYVLGRIIDGVIPSADKSLLTDLVLIVVLINIIRFGTGILSDYLNTWVAGRIVADIKEKLFCNFLKMPFSYFERNKPGEVIQIISQEVDKIQHFLTTSLIRFLNNTFTLLSIGGMLCYLNYRLLSVTLVILPVVIFINSGIGRRVRHLVKNTGVREGELYNFYFERIKNISLVKLFNSFDFEQSQLVSRSKKLNQLYLQNTKLTALGSNGSLFFVSLSPLIILLVGGFQVIDHVMTIGALVAFIQYSNRLIPPANDFLNLYVDYVRAHESAKRIYPYLQSSASEEKTLADEKEIPGIEVLKCCNLCFSVDGKNILNGITMEFVKGRCYGIVGANGAGKSTLVKIIAKLYNPTTGHIIVNNAILSERITAREWSRHITVISQDPRILFESIRDNLAYANRNSSEDELWNSLEVVQLSSYVRSLHNGLDTLIGDGDGCANPSGGQMQKLTLARLLLKKSDVIVLDEVTSAMDDYSSHKIMQCIKANLSDKIIICVTHDLSEAMLLDHVFLLDNGLLVESGNPVDLLSANGKYKELFRRQLANQAV